MCLSNHLFQMLSKLLIPQVFDKLNDSGMNCVNTIGGLLIRQTKFSMHSIQHVQISYNHGPNSICVLVSYLNAFSGIYLVRLIGN